MKKFSKVITVIVFIFLYVPIIVLAVASFSTGTDLAVFKEFTFERYAELFKDSALLVLVRNSAIIAVLSTAIATILGTAAAVGIYSLRPKMKKMVMGLTNIPMTNPDIVTGVSLALMFAFTGTLLKLNSVLGFWTLLIAHITFNLPYVILNVMPRLAQMDPNLTDAALDLGCTHVQAFTKVTLYEILPGVVAGALMSFTMSLDDFVISYFVTGSGFVTLPVEIYNYTKKPIHPKLYALFTLLFIVILGLMISVNVLQARGEKAKEKRHRDGGNGINETGSGRSKKASRAKKASSVKKAGALMMCVILAGGLFAAFGAKPAEAATRTLNIYNWGQYIADGTDGSIDVIAEFEKAYPDIKVNYMTFDSNETMYTKLVSGGADYDLIIPSEYMIEKLIREDMLEKLDFSNIPNYKYIDKSFKNMAHDPDNEYSVPYTWGYVGLIYNSKYVNEEDAIGWDLMWNQNYAGKILMFDNPRDAYAIAELSLGYSLNTEDPDELQAATEKLKAQKNLVQSYVMDQVFDKLQREEAWIGAYYAGDYLTMADENDALEFLAPEEGFNLFVDACCIPKGAAHKEEAELFINFLCDPEIMAANMEYLGYSATATEAKKYMDPEMGENEIAYPSEEVLARGQVFKALSTEGNQLMNELWLSVKTSDDVLGKYLIITGAAIVLGIGLWLFFKIRKARRFARRGRYFG